MKAGYGLELGEGEKKHPIQNFPKSPKRSDLLIALPPVSKKPVEEHEGKQLWPVVCLQKPVFRGVPFQTVQVTVR